MAHVDAAISKQRYVLSVTFFHGSYDVKTANRSPRAKFPPSIVFPLNSTSAKTCGPTLPPPSLPGNFNPMNAQALSENNRSMFTANLGFQCLMVSCCFYNFGKAKNKHRPGDVLYNQLIFPGKPWGRFRLWLDHIKGVPPKKWGASLELRKLLIEFPKHMIFELTGYH